VTDGAVVEFTAAAATQRFFDAVSDLSVVVMAQSEEDSAALEMLVNGAQDYFVKDQSDGVRYLNPYVTQWI